MEIRQDDAGCAEMHLTSRSMPEGLELAASVITPTSQAPLSIPIGAGLLHSEALPWMSHLFWTESNVIPFLFDENCDNVRSLLKLQCAFAVVPEMPQGQML